MRIKNIFSIALIVLSMAANNVAAKDAEKVNKTTIIPKEIKIIDSGKAVAKQTKKILEELDLLTTRESKGTNYFFSNTDTSILKTFVPSNGIVEYRSF